MAGELARFAGAHDLGFDDRSLLEHLLLAADHRSGMVAPFSLTDLARDLSLGPSGRRTLGGRLERLEAAGAVTRAGGGRPGRLEILVYGRLVHAGASDPRRGFVQIVPAALAELAGRHRLSPTAAAVLRRLLVLADARTHLVVATTSAALANTFGLGWRRLGPALEELAGAGVVEWGPGRPLRVLAYDRLVRSAAPAPATARSDGDRAGHPPDRASNGSKSRGSQDVLPRGRDQDLNPKTTPPDPPEARGVPGTDQRGWALVVDLEAKLTEPQRQALHQPADRGRLAQLATELGRLAGGGWASEELLAHVGAQLPGSWRSPARLLWARAQALPTAPPNPEDLRAAADAARVASQIQAAQAYAANQAAVDFLESAEIVARLAECYSGEALEAAVATLAQCRPDDDVAGAVRELAQSPAGRAGPELEDEMIALDVGDMVEADLERRREAMFPWPPDDDLEADSAPVDEGRTRRRSAGSLGPMAVGGLLAGFGEEGL